MKSEKLNHLQGVPFDDTLSEEDFQTLYTYARQVAIYSGLSDPDNVAANVVYSVYRKGGFTESDYPAAYIERAVYYMQVDQYKAQTRYLQAYVMDPDSGELEIQDVDVLPDNSPDMQTRVALKESLITSFSQLETRYPHYHKVVVRRYVLGMSIRQTAYDLDLTEYQVKHYSIKGLNFLRSVLASELDYNIPLEEPEIEDDEIEDLDHVDM
jgi:DNA-directed RNA polymerase specialized sigma24 family protein